MVQLTVARRAHAVHAQVAPELGEHLAAGAARRGRRVGVATRRPRDGIAGPLPPPRRTPPPAPRRWSARTRRSRRCSRRTRGHPPPRARSRPGIGNRARRRAAAPRAPPPPEHQSRQTSDRNDVPAESGGTPRKSATVWPTSANVRRRPSGDRPHARADHQHRHDFARVVGGRGRRVVAVIGGKDNEVLLAHPREQPGQRAIEREQPAVESGHVVPVAPGLVELDHVGEQQAAPHRTPARPRSGCRPRRWSRCGCWRCPARRTGRPPCRPRPAGCGARPADRAASGPAAAG